MFSLETKRALANQLDFSFISVTSQTANISVESYELCVRMSIISGSSTAQCSVSNLIYLLSVVLKYLDSDPQSSIHVPSRVSCFFLCHSFFGETVLESCACEQIDIVPKHFVYNFRLRI